jgi:hypothetical protein
MSGAIQTPNSRIKSVLLGNTPFSEPSRALWIILTGVRLRMMPRHVLLRPVGYAVTSGRGLFSTRRFLLENASAMGAGAVSTTISFFILQILHPGPLLTDCHHEKASSGRFRRKNIHATRKAISYQSPVRSHASREDLKQGIGASRA